MKRLSFSIILILLIIAASNALHAKVTGVCSNCHTMHNSQGGEAMAYDFSNSEHTFSTTASPKATLLIYSCVGCHTKAGTDTNTIVDGVPIVFNVANPVDPLAGGNFHYLIGDGQGDASGHNVVGIKVADTNFNGKNIPGSATSYAGNQVTCAGTKGCHGDRGASEQLDAMKGAHHMDDAAPLTGGTSVGKSYRFLKGILGKEDINWEQDNDNTSHNEYKGPTSPPSSSDSATISSLCAQCHGNFHDQSASGVGTASPWLRHPTDKVLNNSGEYAGYTTYNMLAPVARPDPDSESVDAATVTPGTDIIMCLSCHRVHGSPNYKMIRWNYRGDNSATLTEQLSGCVVCHTSKS